MFLEIVIFFQEGLISVHCNNFGDVRLRYCRTVNTFPTLSNFQAELVISAENYSKIVCRQVVLVMHFAF